MNNPPILNSKKATMATAAMTLITLVMTILPLLFPDVDQAVWQQLAQLLTTVAGLYLGSQGAVDVVKELQRRDAVAFDIEPVSISLEPAAAQPE